MIHDVFLSYSHKDKSVADAICSIMEKKGISCWIAPRDINPGVPFAEAIIDGITGAKVFILVYSSNSNHSQQVIKEGERQFITIWQSFPSGSKMFRCRNNWNIISAMYTGSMLLHLLLKHILTGCTGWSDCCFKWGQNKMGSLRMRSVPRKRNIMNMIKLEDLRR